MQIFWRLILMLVRHQAKLQFLAQAKRTGTLAYLRAVNGSRRILVGLLAAFVLLQIMVLSGFGALVMGFVIWDAEPGFKWTLLFGIFIGMFVFPAVGLFILLSERLWFKASGAEKLVQAVRKAS